MLAGPGFARVSYAAFAVAVLLALLKLGGLSGAKPLLLKTAPATPVAQAAQAAAVEAPEEALDLPAIPTGRAGPTAAAAKGVPISRSEKPARKRAPVFYRPSSGRSKASSGEPVCRDLGDFPENSRAVFPLPEEHFDSYEDTWGSARPQGGHEGTDLMSPVGTLEVAITDGTIVPVKGANKNGWNRLGGYTVMLKAAYDVGPIEKGDLFYYAHMDKKSALPIGARVRAGQEIGVVGDTGEGREGTRGKFPSHLHFGWYTKAGSDRTDLESGAMNPYPLLSWLEENGGAVSGGTDAPYCEAQGPDPFTEEDHWPDQRNPGTRPDLDTGDDARPSPAVEESERNREPSGEQENEPDRRESSGKPDGQTGTTDKDRNASSTGGSEKDDGAKDERDGILAPNEERFVKSAAASEDRASRPSAGEDLPRSRARLLAELEPRRPDQQDSRSSHASALADALRKAKEAERDRIRDRVRDRRDADAQRKKKQKSSERAKPEGSRSAPKTTAAPDREGAASGRTAPIVERREPKGE